jgi:hypothetical protein
MCNLLDGARLFIEQQEIKNVIRLKKLQKRKIID